MELKVFSHLKQLFEVGFLADTGHCFHSCGEPSKEKRFLPSSLSASLFALSATTLRMQLQPPNGTALDSLTRTEKKLETLI